MLKYWFILLLTLPLVLMTDYESRTISEPGFYKGNVINITKSQGRFLTSYQALIDWDNLGRHVISINESQYNSYRPRKRVAAQYNYSWFVGANGSAYTPHDKNYSNVVLWYSISRTIWIVSFFFIIGLSLFRLRKKVMPPVTYIGADMGRNTRFS